MKILYIIHSCKMGGATISFINMLKGVIDKGNKVVVVHPNSFEYDYTLIDKINSFGAKCYPADVVLSYNREGRNAFVQFVRPLFIYFHKIKFYKRLKKIVGIEKPDIIHSNTGVIHEGFYVAKKNKIPHVWHLREYQTKDFNWKPLPSLKALKKLLSKSYTVCITKDIKDYFGLENNKNSFVIYNPVFSLRDIKSADYAGNYLLVANRVSKEKGIEDIIKAFGSVLSENNSFDLKIAGFGTESYINELKTLCKSKGIEKYVHFLEYTDNIIELMLHAKAVVVGSYSEGFGRMTAEANMLGVPVIGRNSAGTKEILNQTGGGYLFETNEELSFVMRKLLEMDNTDIKQFMIQPQEKALSLYASEQHVEKILNLYSKIIYGGG